MRQVALLGPVMPPVLDTLAIVAGGYNILVAIAFGYKTYCFLLCCVISFTLAYYIKNSGYEFYQFCPEFFIFFLLFFELF
jgi:hypothetical protein